MNISQNFGQQEINAAFLAVYRSKIPYKPPKMLQKHKSLGGWFLGLGGSYLDHMFPKGCIPSPETITLIPYTVCKTSYNEKSRKSLFLQLISNMKSLRYLDPKKSHFLPHPVYKVPFEIRALMFYFWHFASIVPL